MHDALPFVRPTGPEEAALPGVPVAVTVGSFTPSVVLDVARTTGRLDDAGLTVTEVPVTPRRASSATSSTGGSTSP
jgi:hypothetical protein